MTLKELKIGETATITAVGGSGALRNHLLDMGLIPGTRITVVKYAPMGDPVELRLHGYELTLRLDDAEKIQVENVGSTDTDGTEQDYDMERILSDICHPGFGEGGKYHDRSSENPLPEGTQLTFALVGNQNCGKTTLFNQLTGSNQ
ncbi:MAG: FeoA domain-containing protein, partial [Anaerovoracaceae bacterium]